MSQTSPANRAKPATSETPTESINTKIAVIETRLAVVERLEEKLQKLDERLTNVELELKEVNTKLDLVLWVGAALATAVIGQFVISLKKSPMPDAHSEAALRFRNAELADIELYQRRTELENQRLQMEVNKQRMQLEIEKLELEREHIRKPRSFTEGVSGTFAQLRCLARMTQ